MPDPVDTETARRTLEAFALVECRMAHERVRMESGAPVTADGGGAFQRLPLCGASVRARRLACGHTTARNDARRVIDALASGGALTAGEAEAFAAELDRLGQAIHLLDHRKGGAERDRAIALRSGPAAVGAAEAAVAALEAEHDRHVAGLRDWRARLLAALGRAGATAAPRDML